MQKTSEARSADADIRYAHGTGLPALWCVTGPGWPLGWTWPTRGEEGKSWLRGG